MKERIDIRKLAFVVPLVITIAATFLCIFMLSRYIYGHKYGFTELFLNVITIIISILSGIIFTFFIKTFTQTPPTLNVSVFGYPNSGKTVYLTVLFNDLMTNQYQDGISFRTYGSETIERISTDYQLLSTGKWLPPTPSDGVFYYHATISLSMLKNYKLQIGDYAGEKFKKELQENNNFFHRTEYFKYAVSSDIVFLAVDLAQVLESFINSVDYVTGVENSFIAALNMMQENRNLGFNRQIRFPVALLFMKADLIKTKAMNESRIVNEFDRLINYCNKNCSSFKYFFVSSTGTRDLSMLMNSKMHPIGVVEPIIWSIKKCH